MRNISLSVPAIPNLKSWKGFILPGLVAVLALVVAVIGAKFTNATSPTEGVNGLVEGLSGSSQGFLRDIGFLAPLGFAFAAGMASSVNPCGFAMLPAYLGLYLGSNERDGERAHVLRRLAKALMVGGVVTGGFALLYGIAGVIIGAGAKSVADVIPWLGLAIGVVLTFAGSWILGGGKLYSALAGRAASRIGNPGEVNIRGYFLFGVSYGLASLSCTLPIFLIVVVTTVTASGILPAIGQFLMYALGMGLIILILTVGMTIFKGAMVGALRKTLPYIQPFSAGLMIVAGAYIVYYWLTLGDLGKGLW